MKGELQSILESHRGKRYPKRQVAPAKVGPTTSEIPDIFFDEILVGNRLGRVEIMVLMALYRQVWCRPNLYKKYGIGPVNSLMELMKKLKLDQEEFYQALQKLESLNMIETIRSGQYFVRKYFTQAYDNQFNQSYDEF